MNFYIEKMILWLKNGMKRTLDFKNDRINVITGNSKTGKTAILEIIDYCLCGSESNVSYEHIGENVLWYGLRFYINGKVYTVARGHFKDEKTFSTEYYFSPIGTIPDLPTMTIGELELKKIIEEEFSISSQITFDYGGHSLKKNSKISYRYFLMLNTLSGDVIDHSKNYFDKMDLDRYRAALPAIFDLSLGITTIENITLQEKIASMNREISKMEKEKQDIFKEIEDKNYNLSKIIKKAKENKIITSSIVDFDKSIEAIKNIFETGDLSPVKFEKNKEVEMLKNNRQVIDIQLVKLKNFQKRYATYKRNLENEKESLKPIKYIKENFSSNINNDEYKQFLNILDIEFSRIKKAIKDKLPFEYNIEEKMKELEIERSELDKKLAVTPNIDTTLKNDWERLIAIGEIKKEFFDLINEKISPDELEEKIKQKQTELEGLYDVYVSPEEKKLTMIEALNDYVQTYIEVAEDALDEYGKYLATFDYTKKVLKLRKSKSTSTANITSSSDHLFMHLCLFLGMHQLIMDNKIPYVLPFLIMDQPSRPYFNNSTFDYSKSVESLSKKDDWNKVKEIFHLLNIYMENILIDKQHFQIIILEHVSTDAWKEYDYVHLVEIFDGINNALIPPTKKDNTVSE